MRNDDASTFQGRLRAAGIVPVLTIPDGADAQRLATLLAGAGLDVIEVTLRTAHGLDAIRAMRLAVPEALIGAGTVLNEGTARAAVDAGAQFLVSPGLHLPVVRVARTAGVHALPGVMTPTEIGLALDEGIDLLKLFPVSLAGGVAWIRALAAPYSEVRFVPTGGIELDDVEAYLAHPSVVAVGGSWIAPPSLLGGDMADVADRARNAAAVVASARARSQRS